MIRIPFFEICSKKRLYIFNYEPIRKLIKEKALFKTAIIAWKQIKKRAVMKFISDKLWCELKSIFSTKKTKQNLRV
jgi:hypothetical protein